MLIWLAECLVVSDSDQRATRTFLKMEWRTKVGKGAESHATATQSPTAKRELLFLDLKSI